MFSLSRRFCTYRPTLEALKRLRDQTSAPFGDCTKALQSCAGDHASAVTWLKQKGLSAANKLSGKDTREGVIASFVTPCRTKAVMLEVNCETDFVARSELFLKFVNMLAEKVLHSREEVNAEDGERSQFLSNTEAAGLFPTDSNIKTLSDEQKILISRLQENIRVRRIMTLQSSEARYGVYVHRAYQDGIGLQACLVEIAVNPPVEEEEDAELIDQFADDMAVQILGSPPQYLSYEAIPQEEIEKETEKVQVALAENLKKAPEASRDHIMSGKLNADYYSKVLLGCMPYVLSSEGKSVSDYWSQIEHDTQKELSVVRFVTWECK